MELLEAAGAPQIPALVFSFAILAKLGPCLAVELDFWIPAPALAEDQREPNASPPLAFLGAAEIEVGLPVVAAAELKTVDCGFGALAVAERGWVWGTWTDVK